MSRLPTVIYTHGGGRLGNQLIRFAHWLAWVEEHRGEVGLVNAGFWPHACDFAHWSQDPGCGYPSERFWSHAISVGLDMLPRAVSTRADWRLQRAVHAAGGLLPGWRQVGSSSHLAEIDLDAPEFLGLARVARATVVAGWRIAGWGTLARHDARTRELLCPLPNKEARAREFVHQLRARADIVSGVLIRHGDYRQWQGGRFFHDAAAYAGWMRRFAHMHPGRKVAFLVTSDEVQDPHEFEGLDVTWSSGSANARGRAIDALLELSACDAILSVPSTFSAWAAHWGRVPIWTIDSGEPESWRSVAGSLHTMRLDPILSNVVK